MELQHSYQPDSGYDQDIFMSSSAPSNISNPNLVFSNPNNMGFISQDQFLAYQLGAAGIDPNSMFQNANNSAQYEENFMSFLSDDQDDLDLDQFNPNVMPHPNNNSNNLVSVPIKTEQYSPDHISGRGASSPIINSDSDSDHHHHRQQMIFGQSSSSSSSNSSPSPVLSSGSTSPNAVTDSYTGYDMFRYTAQQYMNQQMICQAVKDEANSSNSSSHSSNSSSNQGSSGNENASSSGDDEEESEDKVHFVSMNPSQNSRRKNMKKKYTNEDLKNCPTTSLTLPREKLLTLSSKQLEEYAASISAVRPLTEDEQKDLKRQRRLIKNRESAQASRSRRKCQLFELSNQINSLKQERRELKNRVELLENENRKLKHQLQSAGITPAHLAPLQQQQQLIPQATQQQVAAGRNLAGGFASGFANSVWETFCFDRQNSTQAMVLPDAGATAQGIPARQTNGQRAQHNPNYSVSTTGICLLIVMFTFGMFFQNSLDGIGAPIPGMANGVTPMIFPSVAYPENSDAIQFNKRVQIEEIATFASSPPNRKLLEYDDRPNPLAEVDLDNSDDTKKKTDIILAVSSTNDDDNTQDDVNKIAISFDDIDDDLSRQKATTLFEEIITEDRKDDAQSTPAQESVAEIKEEVVHMPNKKRVFSQRSFSIEEEDNEEIASRQPVKKSKRSSTISGPIMGNISIPSAKDPQHASNIEFLLSPIESSAQDNGKQEAEEADEDDKGESPLLLAMLLPPDLAQQLAANLSMMSSSNLQAFEGPERNIPCSVIPQAIGQKG